MAEAVLTLTIVSGETLGKPGAPVAKLLGEVKISQDADVLDLKAAIEVATGVPTVEQQLSLQGGRMLLDHEDIIDFDFTSGMEIPPATGAVVLVRLDPLKAGLHSRLVQGELRLGEVEEAHRGDRDLVLAALRRASQETGKQKEKEEALKHVAEPLWCDREIVLIAVSFLGQALARASAELRGDREVVLCAVANQGLALAHASEALRHDREIILTAVKRNGFVLELLPDDFKGDKEVVLAALTRSGTAFQFVPESLKKDWDVVATAFSSDKDLILPDELKDNVKFEQFMAGFFAGKPGCTTDEKVEGMWG